MRSIADLVREVGRVGRLGDSFVSDVFEGNEEWVSVHAVTRQVVKRPEQRRCTIAARDKMEGTKDQEGKQLATQQKKEKKKGVEGSE
jgi:hypothetical protein